MLAWKLPTAVAATALLAAVTARADDSPKTIVVGSAQVEAVPGAAHDADATLTLTGVLSGSGAVVPIRSEYWLGLFASHPSPALQAQLKLPKDQGLVVESLLPDGPAAKAGLQQHDILLNGNDKPLTGLHDLVKLVDQVKGGKLTLDLLRAGKHETVIVMPAKRPANEPGEIGELWIRDAVTGSSNVGPNFMGGGPLEFRVIRPGQILPPGGPLTSTPGGGPMTMEIIVHATNTLADGSKVEITRHGADPAKVVVTHDKDKWEGTSGDLSKIPEKIRPEVEKLLHPAFDHMHVMATTGGPIGGNVTYFGSPAAGMGLPLPGQSATPAVEKRLDDLQKQIDELRRSVDALRKDRGR